jgi:hypothetical protein
MEKLFDTNLPEHEKLLFSFLGAVDSNLLDNFMENVKHSKIFQDIQGVNKKRGKIILIAVEALQNIQKHANHPKAHDGFKSPATFEVKYNEKDCFMRFSFSNEVSTSKTDSLAQRLDYANSLTREELLEAYRKQLVEGELSDIKSAGLGIFEIIKSSGSPIKYAVDNINEEISLYTYSVELQIA